MTRTCISGFRDRRPTFRRPGNGGGLRSRPSATESPHALAPRLPTLGINPPKMVGPDGNAPSSLAYRANALLLSYEPVAESGGLAPQPAEPIQLFSKQRPHLGGFTLHEKWRRAVVLPHRPCGPKRLPTDHRALRFYSPEKWRRREVMLPSGLAALPASNGCRHACPVSPPKVPPAGIAPASIRLEGGGLSFSATGSGPHGGTPTRNPAFEAPHDCNFTTRGKVVPSRGLAPRSRASRARVLSLGR